MEERLAFKDMSSVKPKFISLFSGAGGLDLGLLEAGFESLLSVEIDLVCRETLADNFPKISLSDEGDLLKLSSKNLLKQAGVRKKELDLLIGGPPCQPFSKSGFWANSEDKRMQDPRANTVKGFMRVVRDILPKVVLIENVSGISYSDKDDGLQYILRQFKAINKKDSTKYKPVINHINSADYGVPQLRQRVFIIACRNGEEFQMPEPTHQPDDSNSDLPVYTTAWDAIGDLDIDISRASLGIKGKWADLVPSIPEGNNYLWHTDRMGGLPLFGWRTRYWSFLLKLAKNKPSWTVTANPGPAIGPLHWKNRYLSIREFARIQTFPDDFYFKGTHRDQQRQVGNAVPPAIGELFGLEIRRQIFNKRVRRKLRLIPLKNPVTPPSERRRKVPKKYLSQVGAYKDHPGVGKGPGAYKNYRTEK